MSNNLMFASIQKEQDATAAGISSAKQIAEITVAESLNMRIHNARKHVEDLCVLKAKAEASGVLNFPASFIANLCHL